MKRISKHLVQVAAAITFAVSMSADVRAESRNLSLPHYLANPGGIFHVPLTLDNASGLAAIRVQINFDPEVLQLESVTAGPLGEAFELSHGTGEGFVKLVLVRAEALAGGSGRLADLKFRANPGAVTDLYSELAIADIGLSDSTGVIDLRQKDTLSLVNGQVLVSPRQDIDNAGSGLPDWWEDLHGLDTFVDNLPLDPEHDGMTNLLEYAFGGNPKVADAHERGMQAERFEANGESFLSMAFHRRLGDSSLHFRLQESTDLGVWRDLDMDEQTLSSPQNMGDGTERVSVIGTVPMSGLDAQPQSFLRVAVEKR